MVDDSVTDQSEDNADFYGADGTHYHNDDQGNTYDDVGNVIGKAKRIHPKSVSTR